MVVNRLFNQFARHEGLQFVRTSRPFLTEDKTPNVELFAKDGPHLSAKGNARLDSSCFWCEGLCSAILYLAVRYPQ